MSRFSHFTRSRQNSDADVRIEEGMKMVSLLPGMNTHHHSPSAGAGVTTNNRNSLSEPGVFLHGVNSLDGDGDCSIYSPCTVIKLRQELKKRGLSQKGLKSELINRLEESDSAMPKGGAQRRKKTESAALKNGEAKTSSAPGELTQKQKMILQKERNGIVLWRRPVITLYYFVLETLELIRELFVKLWTNKKFVLVVLLTFLSVFVTYHLDGPHQSYVSVFRTQFLWCAYWVGLGILSSVGLGTGLHTFLLYLGPHIAAVTLAAFECMSVDFPEPPYPNDIICPEEEGTTMSLLTIISKVRLEAFMWGAGTAIGELPPYFMARTARLSGQIDEEEQEIEELIHEKQEHPSELSILDRGKIYVHDLVQRVGFMGILLCASIPNPLFDLAGITCGHFLVPFWTFFGATLIGKAIIKMHIQKLFVIFVFSEKHVEHVVNLLAYLPRYGESLQVPFKEYLQKQKAKLHHKPGTKIPSKQSLLSWVFEKLVLIMVAYFVLSIINSMAQSYHKRLHSNRKNNKISQE